MTKESIKQAAKFGTVGILNTLVDYVVFYIFIAVLSVDKSISQIFATTVAMSGSYVINKRWTFGETGKTKKRQIGKFIITNLVAMLSTIGFMSLFHDVFRLHMWADNVLAFFGTGFTLNEDMGVMLCKILASCLSVLINFLGNKFWVFKK